MIKLNLSNFPGEIPGFTNGLKLFEQHGWQEPPSSDAVSLLKNALMLERWPLEDNSVSQVKLFFVAEMLDDKEWLHVIHELNRVCCDGALIDMRAHHPMQIPNCDYKRGHAFHDAKFKLLDEAFRKAHPELLQHSYGFSDAETCHLKVNWENIRFDMKMVPGAVEQLSKNGITEANQVIAVLAKQPALFEYSECFCIVHKVPGNNFGLVKIFDIEPFVMRIYPLDKAQFVSRLVKNYGVFEIEESSCVLGVAETIVERKHKCGLPITVKLANVGANLGWYSLLFAQAKPGAHKDNAVDVSAEASADAQAPQQIEFKVDAFEPTPDTVSKFQESVTLNGFEQCIKIYPIALSDEKGVCQLFVDGNNAGSNSLMEAKSEGHSISNVIEISADTFDNIYLNQPMSEWPDLIVMDVEGHEQKVLDGAKGMFAHTGAQGEKWRPAIFTEFSPSLMKLRGQCTYYRDLINLGYKVYTIVYNRQRELKQIQLQELDAQYERLSVNNPHDAHLDLVFLF